MLRWCAYCQGFQGEVAPLGIFTTTHGICPACLAKGMPLLNSELQESHRLRAIQGLLYEAGKTGDTEAASAIIQFATSAGLRPIDILIGLITPLLYRIGNEWESAKITIADQQRFSLFCEHVYELVRLQVKIDPTTLPLGRARVLLFNVPGNDHNLGIRILDLWLQSKGIDSREFHPPPTQQTLATLIEEHAPRAILVSLSLGSQAASLAEIAQRIQLLPTPRPRLIVGGYAVKNRLIQPMEGTLFVETMTGLDDLIWSLPEPAPPLHLAL